MSRRTGLKYECEADCIADIELLRHGYVCAGAWDLAQTCYHCWWPINEVLKPKSSDESAMQSARSLEEFMNHFENLASRGLCEELPSPPRMKPARHTDATVIDDLIQILRDMQNYPHASIEHWPTGAIPFEKFRRFVLDHNAHHFAFLVPTTKAGRH